MISPANHRPQVQQVLMGRHATQDQDGFTFQQAAEKHRPVAVGCEPVIEIDVFEQERLPKAGKLD